jgi:hypothetical protein
MNQNIEIIKDKLLKLGRSFGWVPMPEDYEAAAAHAAHAAEPTLYTHHLTLTDEEIGIIMRELGAAWRRAHFMRTVPKHAGEHEPLRMVIDEIERQTGRQWV